MGINLVSPAGFTSAVLIADTGNGTLGPPDSINQMSKVGNATVSACLELQSTLGGFLPPRMTSAQIAAIVTPAAGMQIFNTDLNQLVVYNGQIFLPAGIGKAYGAISSAASGQPVNFSTIYATPLTIIPAFGAGTMIVVNKFFLSLVWASIQYTLGGAVGLQYNTTAHLAGTAASATIAAADINGATANTIFTAAATSPAENTATATYANLPISISNATQAFATGNSAIRYYVEYSVVPV